MNHIGSPIWLMSTLAQVYVAKIPCISETRNRAPWAKLTWKSSQRELASIAGEGNIQVSKGGKQSDEHFYPTMMAMDHSKDQHGMKTVRL